MYEAKIKSSAICILSDIFPHNFAREQQYCVIIMLLQVIMHVFHKYDLNMFQFTFLFVLINVPTNSNILFIYYDFILFYTYIYHEILVSTISLLQCQKGVRTMGMPIHLHPFGTEQAIYTICYYL